MLVASVLVANTNHFVFCSSTWVAVLFLGAIRLFPARLPGVTRLPRLYYLVAVILHGKQLLDPTSRAGFRSADEPVSHEQF